MAWSEAACSVHLAEAHRISAGEEVLAPAQKRGGYHEVHLVDQPGGNVLANGGNSSAESYVLTLSRLLGAVQSGVLADGRPGETAFALARRADGACLPRRRAPIRRRRDVGLVRIIARIRRIRGALPIHCTAGQTTGPFVGLDLNCSEPSPAG